MMPAAVTDSRVPGLRTSPFQTSQELGVQRARQDVRKVAASLDEAVSRQLVVGAPVDPTGHTPTAHVAKPFEHHPMASGEAPGEGIGALSARAKDHVQALQSHPNLPGRVDDGVVVPCAAKIFSAAGLTK